VFNSTGSETCPWAPAGRSTVYDGPVAQLELASVRGLVLKPLVDLAAAEPCAALRGPHPTAGSAAAGGASGAGAAEGGVHSLVVALCSTGAGGGVCLRLLPPAHTHTRLRTHNCRSRPPGGPRSIARTHAPAPYTSLRRARYSCGGLPLESRSGARAGQQRREVVPAGPPTRPGGLEGRAVLRRPRPRRGALPWCGRLWGPPACCCRRHPSRRPRPQRRRRSPRRLCCLCRGLVQQRAHVHVRRQLHERRVVVDDQRASTCRLRARFSSPSVPWRRGAAASRAHGGREAVRTCTRAHPVCCAARRVTRTELAASASLAGAAALGRPSSARARAARACGGGGGGRRRR